MPPALVYEDLSLGGRAVTRIRRPTDGEPNELDGYVDATMMCKAAGKLWSNYWQNSKTKAYLISLEGALGIPRTLLVHSQGTGAYDERGTWVHPRVATHLAAWCSPEFDVAVHDLVDRYRRGDLNLIPGLLQNHDAANAARGCATVSTACVNVDVALRNERVKAIGATKECGQVICARGLPASFHAIKNNAVNQAAKGFSCTTTQYKKENGIKASESLREYFAAPNQAMVHAMEAALTTKLGKDASSDPVEVLCKIKRKIEDLCAEAGIHEVPLLKEPARKMLKSSSAVVAQLKN